MLMVISLYYLSWGRVSIRTLMIMLEAHQFCERPKLGPLCPRFLFWSLKPAVTHWAVTVEARLTGHGPGISKLPSGLGWGRPHPLWPRHRHYRNLPLVLGPQIELMLLAVWLFFLWDPTTFSNGSLPSMFRPRPSQSRPRFHPEILPRLKHKIWLWGFVELRFLWLLRLAG